MMQHTSPPAALAPLLQAFFTEHLISHRLASPQTADGYRDTFRLLLAFLQRTQGKAPSALCLSDLDAPAILEFLDYLERERRNSIRSRNVRLAAIRAFFRWSPCAIPPASISPRAFSRFRSSGPAAVW